LTRWVLVVIIGAIAGCASSSPLPLPLRPSAMLLAQADRLVSEGQYAGALDTYGEILSNYPDAVEAGRARSGREALAALLAARAQVVRLTAEMKTQGAELVRAREQVTARESDLTRTREQVAARESDLARARQEIARLTAEADRLRADLETLKKIDIDLERRRK
jgi:hypothetical protein